MADGRCRAEDCEAHAYMMDTMRELKDMNERLTESHQELSKVSVKLVENFAELQRTNIRIDKIFEQQKEKDEEQDKKIAEQSSFMNKAVGVLSALTFLVPICLFILGIILKS